MKLIFIYGPPAAGKFTVARELAARTGYKLLHNHQTFDMLEPIFGPLHPAFAPLLNRLRLDIIRTAAQTNLPGLIVTHVYGTDEADFVRELNSAVVTHGGQMYLAQLLPNQAALEQRVVHPGRQDHGKLQSADQLRQLMADWDVVQTVPGLNTLSIDNTNLEPAQVAAKIMAEFGLTSPADDMLTAG